MKCRIDFKENDTISSFEELKEKPSPPGFQFRKIHYCVLYNNLQFDKKKRHLPRFLNVFRVDKELHVQLQLPYWFARGTNAKLFRFGMRINLAPYIRNFSEQNPYSLIEELEKGEIINRAPSFSFRDDTVCTAVQIHITSIVQTTSLAINISAE